MTTRFKTILITFCAFILVTLSCNMEDFIGQDDNNAIETSVAATLDAFSQSLTEVAPPVTDSPPIENPTDIQYPTTSAEPSPTFTPPPDGLSLNCDGTYQRVRVVDGGASGKTIFVDNWNGSNWDEVWSLAGGDPMMQQIEDAAGTYLFGECQYLVIVPIRFTGSGAILELSIYLWDGMGMEEVYRHDGVHGDWEKLGDMITFVESIYLFDEPNCCPCNRQYLEHTWDGSTFVQTGSLITPTYEGDPPDYCQP